MEWSASATQLAILVSITAVSVDIIRRFIQNRIERKGCPLPPGPASLPLLGSALSVDSGEPYKTYTEWRAKYGDIMYIRLLDMDVVVLNSISAATDLFEKRSQIYSDRPFIATIEHYGHDSNFAFARYGDNWRLCRRMFHQTFRPDNAAVFRPIHLRKARQMVLDIMDDPNNYMSHFSMFTTAISLCSAYDYDPSPGDQIVTVLHDFIQASIPALTPEKAVLFKIFPFLLYLPDWLPGSSIKHEARKARELGTKMKEIPFQYAQKRAEYANPSILSDNITRMEELEEPQRSGYESALKQTCSTAFLGSVETTNSTLLTFTLAMVKNPQICKRAQAEIDSVVGTNRLPEFDDRPLLPYVDAILRETLRWQPAAPLGLPHATTCSDVYNGFYIPKGANVYANAWAMTRDETRYPNAEKFTPERFLDAQGMLTDDTPDFVFGFGRRICPGRHSAYASVWSAMVTMLAALDFNLAKNADGSDVTFEAEFHKGLSRHPIPFPCHLTARPHITKPFLERAVTK